jgi:hypothetical protein
VTDRTPEALAAAYYNSDTALYEIDLKLAGLRALLFEPRVRRTIDAAEIARAEAELATLGEIRAIVEETLRFQAQALDQREV